MEPSEEVRHVVRRFFDSVREGDEEAVSHRFSRQPGFERFGSDPAEWWQDGEAATMVLLQQMRELDGGFPWTLVDDVHGASSSPVTPDGGAEGYPRVPSRLSRELPEQA